MTGSKGVLVHEWIEPRGGAENVLDAFAATFPDARIHCLWNDAPERYEPSRVSETWIAKSPLRRSKSLAIPAMLGAWRHLGHAEADWILCSSHLFAHHARFSGPARDARKYVYAHTPARYIWEPQLDTRGESALVRSASALIKPLDRKRASEAYSIAANSNFVRDRIRRCWDLDSEVIYPPVDVEAYSTGDEADLNGDELDILAGLPSEFVLGASRFVPYKQLERTIDVAEASGVAAVLAGDGPHREALAARAASSSAHVRILHRPSRPLLRELYRRSIAYVFGSVEDFGIMPVEAMAAGTPVIARRTGGVSESVIDGLTGVLLDDFAPEHLTAAVDDASRMSSAACLSRAREFSEDSFRQATSAWISNGTASRSPSRSTVGERDD